MQRAKHTIRPQIHPILNFPARNFSIPQKELFNAKIKYCSIPDNTANSLPEAQKGDVWYPKVNPEWQP